ncbi:UbiA family prenyltransferase [Methylobacterium sp. NMS14P]|uniref:UbiA family prenyltransferase n=1 Tax=Methylobacterium sp. NMS14P TaxID=2894310 RepID=UPI002359CDF7|nr:UbiA family prenyltransferase [Methylobacterium sp. NMS14P]WCS23811.1 UbiA family prenyltransferase [Methylobacterium sp. NMS14P]
MLSAQIQPPAKASFQADPIARPSPDVPLILDLDRTLLRADVLYEKAIALVRADLLNLLKILYWALSGRAYLKRRMAQAATLDIEALPINTELMAFAQAEAQSGRLVHMSTATDNVTAAQIARRFSFITNVIASDGVTNLKGQKKAAELARRYPLGFDYAGDSRADLPVWRAARKAIVVEASGRVERAATLAANVVGVFRRPSYARLLFKSMRPHQWVKNALVLVPAILAGRIFEPGALFQLVISFLALSLIASATYILNDIWDVADDRRHWSKKNRPLASGRLPMVYGFAAVPAGLAAGFLLGTLAGGKVVLALAAYTGLTLAYSFYLKRVVLLDALTLACLFTIRLAVGTAAVAAIASPWLFVFSMFLFASLALAKRHTEIARAIARESGRIGGRGYQSVDLPLVLAAGVAAGTSALLILVFYVIDDAFKQTFYGDVAWLWGFPLALSIILGRIWVACQRGELQDDPVVFALTDRLALAAGTALSVCFVLAWAGVST